MCIKGFHISAQENEILEVSAIGQNMISLGALYSSFEESILAGMKFWPDNDVKSNLEVIHHPKQKTFWSAPTSYEDKSELFGITVTGSVGLNVPVGEVKATGSLSFFTRTQVFDAFCI